MTYWNKSSLSFFGSINQHLKRLTSNMCNRRLQVMLSPLFAILDTPVMPIAPTSIWSYNTSWDEENLPYWQGSESQTSCTFVAPDSLFILMSDPANLITLQNMRLSSLWWQEFDQEAVSWTHTPQQQSVKFHPLPKKHTQGTCIICWQCYSYSTAGHL